MKIESGFWEREMKVKPMLFNEYEAKALVDGKKTTTRVLMNPQPYDSEMGYDWWPSNYVESMIQVSNLEHLSGHKEAYAIDLIKDCCPIAQIGDLIYVRESFCESPCQNAIGLVVYRAGYPQRELLSAYESIMDKSEIRWSPSIHMPRCHSRITLKVTDIKIERVKNITETQAKKEGVERNLWFMPYGSDENDWVDDGDLKAKYRTGFANAWERRHRNWNENPYVWVLEFEVIMMNVDKYLELIK